MKRHLTQTATTRRKRKSLLESKVENISYKSLFEVMLKNVNIKNLSEATIQRYKYATRYFLDFTGEDLLCDDILH